MRVLVSGPTGSGKTTQAALLSNYLNISFIGVGRMLRQEAAKGTKLGSKIQKSFDKGVLVNDEIVAKVVRRRVSKSDCKKGFIMDGFPRSLLQLKHFDPKYSCVFYLDVSDKEAKKRLLLRGREDDIPDLIKKRLQIYHRLTEPVLRFYEKEGILHRIKADEGIEKIHLTIKEIIQKKGKLSYDSS